MLDFLDLNYCFNVCNTSETFYFKKEMIGNTEIFIFNYRLAAYKDFVDKNAFELRRLTFVKENDKVQRYLHLHKFFNLNQVEDYQLEKLKCHRVVGIDEKYDGSMIRFVMINGELIAKTKFSLDNEQTNMANKLLANNIELTNWLRKNDGKYACIFELVSPLNRIVVSYKDTELVLLQIRDEMTGEYLDLRGMDLPFVKIKDNGFDKFPYEDLETIENVCEDLEDIEGFVIKLSNGMMLKKKTPWYMSRHGLLTETTSRENTMIQLILNEEIDDLIAVIDDTHPRKKYVNDLIDFVDTYYNNVVKSLINISKSDLDKKDYVQFVNSTYSGSDLCSLMLSLYNRDEEFIADALRKSLIKRTFKLGQARNWLQNHGFTIFEFVVDED